MGYRNQYRSNSRKSWKSVIYKTATVSGADTGFFLTTAKIK